MDVDIIRQDNSSSSKFKIYRKSTHTDQYLNFNSHHPLHQKLGVVRTLFDRAQTLITTEEDRKAEMEHIKSALRLCNYPDWAFDKVESMMKEKKDKSKKKKDKNLKNEKSTPGKIIVLPYVKGLSEAAARVFKKANVTVCFKPATKLGSQIFKLKDKTDPMKMGDSIYEIGCKNCDKVYIGETARPLYVRRKEHQVEAEKKTNKKSFTRQQKKKSKTTDYSSAMAEHAARNNHIIDWENIKVLDREADYDLRGIKEAIHIRQTPKNMNRPQGERHILPHIWDSLLPKRQTQAGLPSQSHGSRAPPSRSGSVSENQTRTSRGRGRGGRRGRR